MMAVRPLRRLSWPIETVRLAGPAATSNC